MINTTRIFSHLMHKRDHCVVRRGGPEEGMNKGWGGRSFFFNDYT